MIAVEAEVVSVVLAAGTVLGGMGYAAGQFFSSRRKGVSDTLATALNEIELLNRVVRRLEEEMHNMAQELAEQKSENAILRGAMGPDIITAMEQKKSELEAYATREHEKTRALIQEVKDGLKNGS